MLNEPKAIAIRKEFLSIEEPYGWIKLKDCTLYEYQQYGDAQYKNQIFTLYYVEGVVVDSSWCGALLCGNPISKAKEKYPKGSIQQIHYVNPSDFEQGKRRYIAS